VENLKLYGFKNNQISYLEALGLAKCFEAYANFAGSEEIMQIGFNHLSGYVYIALENNGITIGSAFGQKPDYITYDFRTGEEYFFDSYDDAMESLQKNYGEE
jgi:hypothetical protein